MNRIKTIFTLSQLFIALALCAQHQVEIKIKSLPSYHQAGAPVYMAGSFNGWNPADERFRLKEDEGDYKIEFRLPRGAYEFKFTRGSWDRVETGPNGEGISNRELIVDGNLDLKLDIAGWQDRFPPPSKRSTRSASVSVPDTAFFIPQLNRYRRIWVYLPPGYSPRGRYPVIYMHDGQNVFDDSTSYSGEWGVDEFFDTTMLPRAIVVAIDNGGQYRLNEYSPYDMERFGKGQGKQYVDFIVHTLKPYIDKRYRTWRTRTHTYIAGSSMGGLISMYAVLRYPNVFGGAGVFSPAFWVAPSIYDEIGRRGRKLRSRIFFYAGKKESEEMVPDMLKAFEKLRSVSNAPMQTVIRDEGRHHESAWRKEFAGFYRWLME